MNGGSTSNWTPPQRQLPRILFLIHESTLKAQLLNNSVPTLRCGNAINVLRARQGIRIRRAPIEEFQDRENYVRRPVFGQRVHRFLAGTICADGEVRRLSLYWVLCCNRLPPES